MSWIFPVLAIYFLRSNINALVVNSGTIEISTMFVSIQTFTDNQILIVSQLLGNVGCFALSSAFEYKDLVILKGPI